MGPLSKALRNNHKNIEIKDGLLDTFGRLDMPEQRPNVINIIKRVRCMGSTLEHLGLSSDGIGLMEAKTYTERHWPLYSRWLNWESI